MTNPYDSLRDEIRRRARQLHKRCVGADVDALRRVRRAPALAAQTDDAIIAGVQRKHCFDAIARALGFAGWPQASRCLAGESTDDMGTFMHRSFGGAHWNIWATGHTEAAAIRREHGGFLLAYRRQFFVATESYIDELGLDPRDEDWTAIERDLSRSQGNPAWARIARSAVRARLFDS